MKRRRLAVNVGSRCCDDSQVGKSRALAFASGTIGQRAGKRVRQLRQTAKCNWHRDVGRPLFSSSSEERVVSFGGFSQELLPAIAHLANGIVDPKSDLALSHSEAKAIEQRVHEMDPDSSVALSRSEAKAIEQRAHGGVALRQTVSPDLHRFRLF